MTIDNAIKDQQVRDCITQLFRHPGFAKLRVAFTSHSPTPKNGEQNETSVAVAHGQNLGTRYVFNKIEELAQTPETPIQKPKRAAGGQDPDLS